MPTLSLRYEGEWVNGYLLKDGMTLKIGRNTSNDVVIDNRGVSGYHAKIDGVNGRFLLTDLQSKNGTFVNGELSSSCWLNHGDTITIGKHVLYFDNEADDLAAATPANMGEKTLIMDTDQYQAMLAGSFGRDGVAGIKKELVALLSFMTGGNGEVRLTKKLTKLGKDPVNDVVIRGFLVGKVSATISERPSGYHLSYVSGFSKPKVNGKSVKQTVKLEEFDIIEIGPTKMQFVTKAQYRK